ncbi:hypothetical protein BDV93DRAFT_217373 [Ceratobasidium sp. AG-I]|nr:hypothetical protein BDV93DRAFT_217373 [Ceratobasidium sp. AG-I]
MSIVPDDCLAGAAQDINLGGNNRARPQNNTSNPPTLFSHLDETEQELLLRDAGYLYGCFIDSHDGPRQSIRKVARQAASQSVLNFIHEHKNLVTKVLLTNTDRDANFAHQGWSTSAMSVTTPWIASRIAKHNRAPKEDSWITRRMVVQRVSVNLTLRDLQPNPEFEGDVVAALGKPSRFEKFQALDEVFRTWGDVIPLALDLGVSLSITDLKANYEQPPTPTTNPNSPYNLIVSRTAEINTQGGEANFLPDGNASEWLSKTVQPQRWCQVRVMEVAPITDLLKPEIKSQIAELYSALLSYCPPNLRKPVEQSQCVDGGANGLKTISRLKISSGKWTDAMCAVYLDGTVSDGWHDGGFKNHDFKLNGGEYITEVVVWSSSKWVFAIQFITSNGRVSPHYGGDSGIPSIMTAEDGVLVAFSGTIRSNSFEQIQTVWRHDALKASPSQNSIYFKYFGGDGGTPFNDRGFIKSPETHISSINIRSSSQIDGIRSLGHI